MHLLRQHLLCFLGDGFLSYLQCANRHHQHLHLLSSDGCTGWEVRTHLRHGTFVGSMTARDTGSSIMDAVGHDLLDLLGELFLELLRDDAVAYGVGAGG